MLPIIMFKDNKKVDEIPNEIFPLVITAIMENFNILRILINGGDSCDIIYAKLFEKLRLKKEKLSPNIDFDMQAFNGLVICL